MSGPAITDNLKEHNAYIFKGQGIQKLSLNPLNFEIA
jgi:hypothetical protein